MGTDDQSPQTHQAGDGAAGDPAGGEQTDDQEHLHHDPGFFQPLRQHIPHLFPGAAMALGVQGEQDRPCHQCPPQVQTEHRSSHQQEQQGDHRGKGFCFLSHGNLHPFPLVFSVQHIMFPSAEQPTTEKQP